MQTCKVNSKCGGHLAKFDDCLSEWLYLASLDGIYDTHYDGCGNSVSVVTIDSPAVVEFDGALLVIPVGTWLVFEDDRGFVDTEKVSPEQAWECVQQMYDYDDCDDLA